MVRKFCILLAGLLLTACAGLSGCEKDEEKKLVLKDYFYSFTDYTGETSYYLTNLPPERMTEEAELYDNWTLVRTYEFKGDSCPVHRNGSVGSVFLFWDTYWFLYDMETGEETPVVGLLEDYDRNKEYILLGDTEPTAIVIYHRESKFWGIFSIGADRMISDYEYLDVHHKEMIDSKIAVLTEEGAYLLDPLTGELCGETDPALFED